MLSLHLSLKHADLTEKHSSDWVTTDSEALTTAGVDPVYTVTHHSTLLLAHINGQIMHWSATSVRPSVPWSYVRNWAR